MTTFNDETKGKVHSMTKQKSRQQSLLNHTIAGVNPLLRWSPSPDNNVRDPHSHTVIMHTYNNNIISIISQTLKYSIPIIKIFYLNRSCILRQPLYPLSIFSFILYQPFLLSSINPFFYPLSILSFILYQPFLLSSINSFFYPLSILSFILY